MTRCHDPPSLLTWQAGVQRDVYLNVSCQSEDMPGLEMDDDELEA